MSAVRHLHIIWTIIKITVVCLLTAILIANLYLIWIQLVDKDRHIIDRHKSGLIITHTGYILDYIEADAGHMLCDGEIKCHGNPREILKLIQEKGYRECIKCQKN